MSNYDEYEQVLNRAESLQAEMHKFISDAQRFAKQKGRTVPGYESLKTVFILTKIAELQKAIMPICKKCGGKCKPSTALINQACGSPEFSDGHMSGATLSPSSEAVLVRCLKCEDCGHSFTNP